jgi:hypothetical protein
MPHITFIHGIANKPPEGELLKIWLSALADESLGNNDGINPGTYGITSSMIYWADVLYEKPLEEAMHESAGESTDLNAEEPGMEWLKELPAEEYAVIKKLAGKLLVEEEGAAAQQKAVTEFEANLERIPLPWPVKRLLMKILLKDVHHYLFNFSFSPRAGTTYKVQDEIRQRVLTKLKQVNTDRHIIVSHSMGTVIMYDCLKRLADCPAVDAVMTIGSPLGIAEVQDCLKPEWTRQDGFAAKIKGPWVNVYDKLDPVTGFDGNIANDFMKNNKKIIEVINEQNEGAWRHDISKYLRRPMLRAALSRLLDL